MVAAGAAPSYPRPRPPSRGRLWGALVATVALALAGIVGRVVLDEALSGADSEAALHATMALSGGRSEDLGSLALLRYRAGDLPSAATLYGAATQLDPRSVYHPANGAIVLGALGRCDEAAESAEEARARLDQQASPAGAELVRSAWESVRICRARVDGVPAAPQRD
jgi:tetratricopeptide (TPR) repeat protein